MLECNYLSSVCYLFDNMFLWILYDTDTQDCQEQLEHNLPHADKNKLQRNKIMHL